MKLSDLLKALSYNTNVNVTLLDPEDVELITFNAVGYKAVESELGKKKVKKIKIDSATAVTIALDEEEVTEETEPTTPDPEPTDPTGGD
jgi:hypothetical protein